MARSILQTEKVCIISGCSSGLEKHHVFGGANRKRSERLGLWVYLRHDLHNMTPYSVHMDRQLGLSMKKWAQRICMEVHGMTEEDFIREFGKNYIQTEGDYELNPPFGYSDDF